MKTQGAKQGKNAGRAAKAPAAAAAAAPAPGAARRSKSKAPPAAAAPAEPTLRDVLTELAALKQALAQSPPAPQEPNEALENGVTAVRRVLSDLLEARAEAVLRRLAAIRGLAAALRDGAAVVEAVDRLLAELGALRFEAERLDYVDPLVHRVAAERREPNEPDGVILETLQPGFRTARGVLIEKAAVAVNRRG